jgi:hypothetical protein
MRKGIMVLQHDDTTRFSRKFNQTEALFGKMAPPSAKAEALFEKMTTPF